MIFCLSEKSWSFTLFKFEEMQEIVKNFTVVHVDAPGQEEGAAIYPVGCVMFIYIKCEKLIYLAFDTCQTIFRSSESVSGFTSSVFFAHCDSVSIFMLSHVLRPLCLMLDVLTVLKCFYFLWQIPVRNHGSDLWDASCCPAVL